MSTSSAVSQRARVAALARHRNAADPELAEAHARLSEDVFLAAVERALAAAPELRPETRDRVIALLSSATGNAA